MTTTAVKSPTRAKRAYHKTTKTREASVKQDAARVDSTSYPKLSYHKALSSWFLSPDGCIRNVGTCEDAEFRAFITALLPLAWRECDRRELFSALAFDDDVHKLGRWYLLDDLAHRRIHVPLFSTEQEAAESL